jgi:hypothetical protein
MLIAYDESILFPYRESLTQVEFPVQDDLRPRNWWSVWLVRGMVIRTLSLSISLVVKKIPLSAMLTELRKKLIDGKLEFFLDFMCVTRFFLAMKEITPLV